MRSQREASTNLSTWTMMREPHGSHVLSSSQELEAPTGQWKSILAYTMMSVCAGLWIWIYIQIFVHTQAPSSFSEEARALQYWRQEALNNQPISGNYKPPNADKYKPVYENPDNEDDEDDEKDA